MCLKAEVFTNLGPNVFVNNYFHECLFLSLLRWALSLVDGGCLRTIWKHSVFSGTLSNIKQGYLKYQIILKIHLPFI